MSVLSVLIKDLVERTTLADNTCFIAGTVDANKITFSNLVAAIKGKLGTAAQKSVANNLTTASSGTSVLDAYQGKLLSDRVGKIESDLGSAITRASYNITLEKNAYVSPYQYYLNWYIPDADVTKYGIPISLAVLGTGAVPEPCSLVYSSGVKKYRCTAIAMSAAIIADITFIKLKS